MEEVTALALEKFKRRLVREIARRMRQRGQEESDIWPELNAEYGCDCQLMWNHMKSLTLKKLRRLLAAEDRVDIITKIARMTITDWLTFDLMLVHEKVDVIGEDLIQTGRSEPAVHTVLFGLIQKHAIDRQPPHSLCAKWLELTKEYNACGRQCSPMLLQRRWYQLKRLTRERIYDFWREYRGNPKNYERAIERRPTVLQMRIAEKYKDLIIRPFPEWDVLVETKRIILAEEYMKMSLINKKNSNTENHSDLVQIENGHQPTDTNNDIATINNIDTAYKEKEVEGAIAVKNEILNDMGKIKDSDAVEEVQNVYMTDIKMEQNSEEHNAEAASDFVLPKITCVMGNVVMPGSTTNNEEIEGTLESKATASDDEDCVEFIDSPLETGDKNVVIIDVESENVMNLNADNINVMSAHLELIDDGIELEDEVEYPDLEKSLHLEQDQNLNTKERHDSKEIADIGAESVIDEKLIMFPITYTTKLEDMKIFKNKSFLTVKERGTLERAISESKPVFKIISQKERLHYNEIADPEVIPRVKFTSWRLQKPKSRSYNPIQLCKNPDFNTRLKRLTAGFFSSERNRLLFSSCRPLTVDLHKGFESKLVENTLYLESTDRITIKQEKIVEECDSTVSIMPSAVPVQSLLDNVKDKSIKLLHEEIGEPKELLSPTNAAIERCKVIKLPDINQIRLTNQKLLIAEVSPINNKNEVDVNQAPVQLVDLNSVEAQPDTSQSEFETYNDVPMSDKIKCFPAKKKTIIPKMRAPVTLPAWSVSPYNDTYYGSLITKDTLAKMLSVLKGDELDKTKSKRSEIVKKTFENKDDLVVKEKTVTPIGTTNNVKESKGKVNVWSRHGYCCWAQYRSNPKPKCPSKLRHLCTPPVCKCCCRDQLLKKFLVARNTHSKKQFMNNYDHTDILENNSKTHKDPVMTVQETDTKKDSANDLAIENPPAGSIPSPLSNMMPDKSSNIQTVIVPSAEETDSRNSDCQTSTLPTLNTSTSISNSLPSTDIVNNTISKSQQAPMLNNSHEPIDKINTQTAMHKEPNISASDATCHTGIADTTTNQILPDGVKFILLPDNTVGMSIDPNVKINPADLAKLPEILIAVQKQLSYGRIIKLFPDNSTSTEITNDSSHANTIATDEKFSLGGERSSLGEEKSSLGDSNTSQTDANMTAINMQEASNVTSNNFSGSILQDISVNTNSGVTKQTNCESLECLNKGSLNVLQSNNDMAKRTDDSILPADNHDVKSSTTMSHYKRNSILSDLMSISGISQEDVNSSIEEASTSTAVITRLSDSSMANIVSNDKIRDTIPMQKPLKKVIIDIRPRQKRSLQISNDVIDLTEENQDEVQGPSSSAISECYDQNVQTITSVQRPVRIFKLVRDQTYNSGLNSPVPYKIVKELTQISPNEKEKLKINKIAKRLHSNEIAVLKAMNNENMLKKRHHKSESDSSDDEPLAEKRKRISESLKESTNIIAVPIENSENIVSIEKYSIPVEFEMPEQL